MYGQRQYQIFHHQFINLAIKPILPVKEHVLSATDFYAPLEILSSISIFPASSLQATRCRGIRQMPAHASMTGTFLITRAKTQSNIFKKSPKTRLNQDFFDSKQIVSTCIETLLRINIRARHEAHLIFYPRTYLWKNFLPP